MVASTKRAQSPLGTNGDLRSNLFSDADSLVGLYQQATCIGEKLRWDVETQEDCTGQ